MQPASFVQDMANNISAHLLQYLIIHRMIIEELLVHTMSKDRTDSLHMFDKFLIRDRFDVKDARPTQMYSFLPASWAGDTHEETDVLPISDREEKEKVTSKLSY